MNNVQRTEHSFFNTVFITVIIIASMLFFSSGVSLANISSSSTDSVTISAEIDSAEAQLAQLQEAYLAAQVTYQEALTNYNAALDQMDKAYGRGNLKLIARRQDQVDTAAAELEAAQAELEAIARQITAMQDYIVSLNSELEAALIAEAAAAVETSDSADTTASTDTPTTDASTDSTSSTDTSTTDTGSGSTASTDTSTTDAGTGTTETTLSDEDLVKIAQLETELATLQASYDETESVYLSFQNEADNYYALMMQAQEAGDMEKYEKHKANYDYWQNKADNKKAYLDSLSTEMAAVEEEMQAIESNTALATNDTSTTSDTTEIVSNDTTTSTEPSAPESIESDTSSETTIATGSATLTWSAPTTRTDGSPIALSDIKAFKIYRGEASGNYSETVEITDPSKTSHVFNALTAGTHYFSLIAIDVSGVESTLSSEAAFTIQ